MFNTFWNPFLSEAELVCPQSCFLLNCLHAHYPSFLQLAPPPPGPRRMLAPVRGPEERAVERHVWAGGLPLEGTPSFSSLAEAGTLLREVPPKGSPLLRLSRGSQCTLSRSAVRSKNALWSQAQKCLWQAQAEAGLQKM